MPDPALGRVSRVVTDVLLWILLLESLAWAWFVLAWPLFARWPDRGLGLSKCGAVLIVSAPVWTLAWFGLPSMTRAGCWAAAVAAVGLATIQGGRQRKVLTASLRIGAADLALVEVLWLGVLAVFLVLRAARPAIDGAEKFMDAAFLNTAVRSTTLPLPDPWLAGLSANYHYFGFVAWAVVARMADMTVAVAYNLAAASLPAAVAAGACSIAWSYSGSRRAAVGTALILVFAGTLAAINQVAVLGQPFDLWNPTRVIPGTINEFPFFTFIWGDLHSHLLAMPSFVLVLGLASRAIDEPDARTSAILFALVGAAAGLSVVTSTWDAVPIAIVGSGLAVARQRFGARRVFLDGVAAAAAALTVALPAALTVAPGAVAAGPVTAASPLGAFLLVQGLMLLPSALLMLPDRSKAGAARWLIAGIVAILAALATGSSVVFLLTMLSVAAWSRFVAAPRGVHLLTAAGPTLLLIPEIVFVDDIYGPALQRMNTVFKLHLHASIVLAMTALPIGVELWRAARGPALRMTLAGVGLVAGCLAAVYPVLAGRSLLASGSAWTLDGSAFLATDQPGDFAVINYLNREVRGTPAIVEATGDAYSYAARIASHTGLPAVVGWANHELVWRRDPSMVAEIARRVDAVRDIYVGDTRRALELIQEFRVRYVVVGQVERRTYPDGDFAKFETIARKVVDSHGAQLFAVGEGVTP